MKNHENTGSRIDDFRFREVVEVEDKKRGRWRGGGWRLESTWKERFSKRCGFGYGASRGLERS